MTEQSVLEKYKGGLSLFKGFKTIELLLDEKNTNDNELYFLGYDANMYPLPDFATFPLNYQSVIKLAVKGQLSDWKGAVYIDGTKVLGNY